jgi:DNA-binding response OmpR family regulator
MFTNNYKFNNEVLLIEDDHVLGELLKMRLKSKGLRVTHCSDGESGLNEALKHKYKLIVMDIGLPKLDGMSILRTLNSKEIKSSVMVITSRNNDDNQIETFKNGGRIFHSKPINMGLFDAQIDNLISSNSFNTKIDIGDLSVEPDKMYVKKSDQRLDLTPREFEVLMYIIDADGKVLSRDSILSHISKGDEYLEESTIDKIVSRLRKKIGTFKEEQIIETVHGQGYRLHILSKPAIS